MNSMNLQNGFFKALFSACSATFVFGLICLGLAGCSSTPDLTLTSITNGRAYHQGFVTAYTSRNSSGDTDVVLVDEATQQQLGGQQTAAAAAAVRQVMHIRIIWTPSADMNGSAANAAVKWYVIGHSQPQDILEYTGTAFVAMSQDDDGCTLKVQNAFLKPSTTHGSLTDPVGLSRLEGKFTAHADAAKVKQILTDLRATVAAAKAATPAVTSVTPARATEH
jgi:hypothetical protein